MDWGSVTVGPTSLEITSPPERFEGNNSPGLFLQGEVYRGPGLSSVTLPQLSIKRDAWTNLEGVRRRRLQVMASYVKKANGEYLHLPSFTIQTGRVYFSQRTDVVIVRATLEGYDGCAIEAGWRLHPAAPPTLRPTTPTPETPPNPEE